MMINESSQMEAFRARRSAVVCDPGRGLTGTWGQQLGTGAANRKRQLINGVGGGIVHSRVALSVH